MMAALLDVNTLVALAWPNHVHHVAAHEWFSVHHPDGWATCPLTEDGFVRVSSNPRATPEAKTPGEAILLLQRMIELSGYEFWQDDVSLAQSDEIDLARLVGYRQVSDARLVALAIRRQGRLVTFDRGLTQIVPRGVDPHDLLIILD